MEILIDSCFSNSFKITYSSLSVSTLQPQAKATIMTSNMYYAIFVKQGR